MPPAGLEPSTPASERLQTHALDRAATGISGYERMISHWKPKIWVLRDVKVRFFTAYETGHYARQALLQDLASYLIL